MIGWWINFSCYNLTLILSWCKNEQLDHKSYLKNTKKKYCIAAFPVKNIIWRITVFKWNIICSNQNWVDKVLSFIDIWAWILYPLSLSTALLHSFSLMLCPASLMTTSVTNSSLMPGHDCSTSSKAFFSSSMASPCPEPTGVSWRSLNYSNLKQFYCVYNWENENIMYSTFYWLTFSN